MTRDEIAKKLHWHRAVWFAGFLNPFMITPQLYKIWSTGEVAGVSLGFLYILAGLQGTFSIHGFFTRDRMIMWSNGLAAASTVAVIISVSYFS